METFRIHRQKIVLQRTFGRDNFLGLVVPNRYNTVKSDNRKEPGGCQPLVLGSMLNHNRTRCSVGKHLLQTDFALPPLLCRDEKLQSDVIVQLGDSRRTHLFDCIRN